MSLKAIKPALKQLKGRDNLIGAEIGVWLGVHALFYLKELDIKRVFLIDPYAGYKGYDPVKEFGMENLETAEQSAHARLRNYKQEIKWIKKKSAEATGLIDDDSLDFVYIDGNHSFDSVMEDISLYYPKLKKGGLLSGHDYDLENVKRAVDASIKSHDLILHIENGAGFEKKIDWWAWKG